MSWFERRRDGMLLYSYSSSTTMHDTRVTEELVCEMLLLRGWRSYEYSINFEFKCRRRTASLIWDFGDIWCRLFPSAFGAAPHIYAFMVVGKITAQQILIKAKFGIASRGKEDNQPTEQGQLTN